MTKNYIHTFLIPVPKSKLKAGETILLGMVTCKSKAHCEKVMDRVMKDEALGKAWDAVPFDGMRIIYGGFKTFLEA